MEMELLRGWNINYQMIKQMNEKGVVELISTVLLIAIVFILAVIILVWARIFIVDLGPVGLSCNEINFDAGVFCSSGICALEIVNKGNVPLEGFVIKSRDEGTLKVEETITETVAIGGSASLELQEVFNTGTDVLIVPTVIEEDEPYTCPDRIGVEGVV
jgi:flagellin-like protein